MLYIINLIFSCFYLSQIREKRTLLFILKILPVILLWVLIVGGQYRVGADYDNYLAFFSYPHYETRFERLFTWMSRVAHNMGIVGQGQFFLYGFINAIVIFIASHRLGIKHWGIFYLLLVTVSTFFNNQMNGIRQCTAVAFVYWAFVEMYISKLKGLSLIAISVGFHVSAIIGVAFTYIKKVTQVLTRYPKFLLIVCCVISLIPVDENINQSAIELLPEEVIEETHYERMYVDNESTSKSTDIIYKLSKLFLLPLYLYSLRLLKTDFLTDKEKLIFRFGLLSYSLRCALLVNQLIGRFSYYFWIPSILPLYYLCTYMYERRQYTELIFILLYASIIYFIKVFMGVAEYQSSFIYFQYIF